VEVVGSKRKKVFLFLKIYIPEYLNVISLADTLVYMQKQTSKLHE
jgi:hypothetical protein